MKKKSEEFKVLKEKKNTKVKFYIQQNYSLKVRKIKKSHTNNKEVIHCQQTYSARNVKIIFQGEVKYYRLELRTT